MTTPVFGVDRYHARCKGYHPEYACPLLFASYTEAVRGTAAKDRGMALVTAAERSSWPAKAEAWIRALPSKTELDAESLTKAIGRPERPNVTGAFFSAMAKAGVIRKIGYETASRKERHASVMARWVRR